MHNLKIHNSGKISVTRVPHGAVLLEILRAGGFEIYAPCGGNGTCGKCKVYNRDEGYINSCHYHVQKELEIILPGSSEAKILESQYMHSRQLDPDPGSSALLSSHPVGIAIDIGTTTLVFHFILLSTGALIETHTTLNPQAICGSDVISRINYCIMNPEGLNILQSEIIKAINSQIVNFARKTNIITDDIVKIGICGNTTMLHILLGVNPAPLAYSPFTPVFTEEMVMKASEMKLDCNHHCEVKVLPSLSAYIGADIVAGIASLNPDPGHKNTLFIDLGTNGEIALITAGRIHCCATAAGPAFEGANIEPGMGAVQGAIKSYSSPGNYQTIGDSKPLGICGSGLIDVVASLIETGHIKSDGYMESNFNIASPEESGTPEGIYLTPKDVREVQLAKSAIASGINILVQRAGLSIHDIDALFLAGGFGNYVDTESAVKTGIIPYQLRDKIIPVGNTSGTGALLSVKSFAFDGIVDDILSRMSYYELSGDDDFVLQFAMNMEFSV